MKSLINECLQKVSMDLNLTSTNLTTSDGERIINFLGGHLRNAKVNKCTIDVLQGHPLINFCYSGMIKNNPDNSGGKICGDSCSTNKYTIMGYCDDPDMKTTISCNKIISKFKNSLLMELAILCAIYKRTINNNGENSTNVTILSNSVNIQVAGDVRCCTICELPKEIRGNFYPYCDSPNKDQECGITVTQTSDLTQKMPVKFSDVEKNDIINSLQDALLKDIKNIFPSESQEEFNKLASIDLTSDNKVISFINDLTMSSNVFSLKAEGDYIRHGPCLNIIQSNKIDILSSTGYTVLSDLFSYVFNKLNETVSFEKYFEINNDMDPPQPPPTCGGVLCSLNSTNCVENKCICNTGWSGNTCEVQIQTTNNNNNKILLIVIIILCVTVFIGLVVMIIKNNNNYAKFSK